MKVRAKKQATRKGEVVARPAAAHPFPAPMRGLVLNENEANPSAGGALVLDNWVCTTKSVRVRHGFSGHAVLAGAVRSLFPYRSGTSDMLFATTDTAIYDASSLSETTAPTVVTGQTEGVYSTHQFGTTGGDFLYAVNGGDEAQLFDGATWIQINATSTPAFTGVDTANLQHVWSYASRLFFVEKDTLDAWYLPVDSIAGTAQRFSLAGIFKRGGKLLFGATWSLDAGDGLDDKCIFVSTEGEVAIYSGTNPGSAADWNKDGVYRITKPLGPRGIIQAGGDLLVATEVGLVPISAAINKDVAALEMDAVSSAISPLWQSQAALLGSRDWQIEKWPSKNIMIVSQPEDAEKTCLVANLQTGAWSRFTGMETNCLAFFDTSVFFGDTTGNIYRMESGGSDNGDNYLCRYLGLHEGMGAAGQEKTILQARTTFQTRTEINPLVTVKADYDQSATPPPNAALDTGAAALWDVSLWDVAVWDGATALRTEARWTSIGVTGYAIAPEIQLTFGNVAAPDVDLVGVEMTYETGAMVT